MGYMGIQGYTPTYRRMGRYRRNHYLHSPHHYNAYPYLHNPYPYPYLHNALRMYSISIRMHYIGIRMHIYCMYSLTMHIHAFLCLLGAASTLCAKDSRPSLPRCKRPVPASPPWGSSLPLASGHPWDFVPRPA